MSIEFKITKYFQSMLGWSNTLRNVLYCLSLNSDTNFILWLKLFYKILKAMNSKFVTKKKR